MEEDLNMLKEFNSLYQKNATIFTRHYPYDLDNAFTVTFYEVVEDIEPSHGYLGVRQIVVVN